METQDTDFLSKDSELHRTVTAKQVDPVADRMVPVQLEHWELPEVYPEYREAGEAVDQVQRVLIPHQVEAAVDRCTARLALQVAEALPELVVVEAVADLVSQ